MYSRIKGRSQGRILEDGSVIDEYKSMLCLTSHA